MQLRTILLAIIILVNISCKQQIKKEKYTTKAKTEIVPSETVPSPIMAWVDALNSNDSGAVEQRYAANAVTVISADSILESAAQIAAYYGNQKTSISAIESLFSIEANKKRGISYEIISYTTEEKKEYLQLVIWRLENGQLLREFEFTERSNPAAVEVETKEIDDSRNLWLALCNANKAENLVKQLYTANTIYFNHKPIVQGFDDLITEYAYMNNPEYNLDLQPLKMEVVNPNYAFEIGQCSGSYNGNYILIWKKQADGNWKIFIDSNI